MVLINNPFPMKYKPTANEKISNFSEEPNDEPFCETYPITASPDNKIPATTQQTAGTMAGIFIKLMQQQAAQPYRR